MDFEAFEPEAKDWPAVRSLLKQLLLRAEVDVGDLSDIVITQAKETSIVMKQIEDADDDDEEDEDEIVTKKLSKKSTSKSLGKGNDSAIQVTPSGSSSSLNAGNHLQSAEDTQNLDVFSVTSLLNLNDGSVRSRRGVQQLLQMLRQTAESNRLANAAASDALLKVLDDQSGNRVGLCLNERFINLPYRVGFESLQHVLAESERKHIKFTHFVMISKLLRPKLSERKKKGARKSADKSTTETPFKKPKLIDTNDENSIRLNPEDDLFVELADAIIEYETDTDFVDCTVNVNWESGTDFLPFRQILLFNSRSFKNAIKRLKQNLEDFSETIQ